MSHHHHTPSVLDINSVTHKFTSCISGDDIILSLYCDAYEEIAIILTHLGVVFRFVSHDVDSKIKILRNLVNSSDANLERAYKTIDSMTSYESQQLQNNQANAKHHHTVCVGSRNLLRLHRALQLVVAIIRDICTEPPERTLVDIARKAYDRELSKHHPWLVRKTVHLAVHSLPTRDQLVESIVKSQPPTAAEPQSEPPPRPSYFTLHLLDDHEACRNAIQTHLVPAVDRVYDLVHAILDKRNMTDLP